MSSTINAAKSRHATQQGFTLIELVIVLAVLGALAAIAVPQLTGFQGDAELQGVATATSSEANNAFANDLVSGSMDNWVSGDVCSNINDGTIALDSFDNSEYSVADAASTVPDDAVEMAIPTYDTDNEQVTDTRCQLEAGSTI